MIMCVIAGAGQKKKKVKGVREECDAKNVSFPSKCTAGNEGTR